LNNEFKTKIGPRDYSKLCMTISLKYLIYKNNWRNSIVIYS